MLERSLLNIFVWVELGKELDWCLTVDDFVAFGHGVGFGDFTNRLANDILDFILKLLLFTEDTEGLLDVLSFLEGASLGVIV